MVSMLPWCDTLLVDAFQHLCRIVSDFGTTPLDIDAIRVPLDVQRPSRPSRQWHALTLSENRVGTAIELVGVLGEVVELQQRANAVLPLLVDEKIHYSVYRLLYSSSYAHLAGRECLRQVPLLYGVWHPYKHTLTLVYRAFLPVFALLESTSVPQLGVVNRHARKVVYMEKMVAALLHLPADIRQTIAVTASCPADRHVLH
jgi:hypothetical protein